MKLGNNLIIGSLVVIIIVAFVMTMSSREENRVKEPVSDSELNATYGVNEPGDHDIGRFSDKTKQKNVGTINGTSNTGVVPFKTSSSLPYPRITIDYAVRVTSSIRDNAADSNHTFVIIMMDIRNYGYKYFDAHSSRFRVGEKGDIEPLVSVTTGNVMDAVIPNSSRAKGDLVFLLNKGDSLGEVRYITKGEENYYITYRGVPSVEDTVSQPEVTNDE